MKKKLIIVLGMTVLPNLMAMPGFALTCAKEIERCEGYYRITLDLPYNAYCSKCEDYCLRAEQKCVQFNDTKGSEKARSYKDICWRPCGH